MADVFISYSRKDIAFARILHAALDKNGLETWIDWQDIPPSVDWLAEVYEAIEGSDSFVFIISPTSVSSEICLREIEHAAKNNKRLIPIVVNNIDPTTVPPAMAQLNWIFFREGEEVYASAVKDLITAIQIDQSWVKAHTRLQTRALEWERKEHEAAYFLRGGDLNEAEAWLSTAGEKDPQPTALQTQFIIASRSGATRRQRITLGAAGVGLVIAIALSILAWSQRNLAVEEGFVRATAQSDAESAQATAVFEADARATEVIVRETAQAEAETQRDLAISRELAVQSANQLEKNGDLALLLAIEALRVADTQEAGIAIREALLHPGRTLLLLSGHNGAVHSAEWNKEGTLILTGGEDGTARIWDAQTGIELSRLGGHTQAVLYATWSNDGTRIVTTSQDNTAKVWNVEVALQGAPQDPTPMTLAGHSGEILFAAWNDDDTRILTTSNDGTIRVWDAKDGREVVRLSGHELGVEYAAWNPDGSYIISSDGQTVRLWDAGTGDELAVIDRGLNAGSYAAWNDEGTKIVTTGSMDAEVWDTELLLSGVGIDLEEHAPLAKHTQFVPAMWMGEIVQATWDKRGSRILSVSLTGTAEIWDPVTGQTIVSLVGHTDSVIRGEWDPSGGRVLTASTDGTARVWDPASGNQVAMLTGHDGAITDASWSPRGDRVLTASSDGTARIWTVDTIEETLALTNSVQERAYWNEDGSLIASSGYSTQIWDAQSGEELAEFEGNFATWSPDGERLLLVLPEGSMRIWDTTTPITEIDLEEMMELVGHTKKVIHATWNESGSHIATISRDGSIRLWDSENGDSLILLDTEDEAGTYAEWNQRGDSLLAVHPQGLYVWDINLEGGEIESANLRYILKDEMESLHHATWSPDGTRILTTSDEGAVIWEAQEGKKLLELIGHTGPVNYAVWSPDGGMVLTTSSDNTARIWNPESGRTLKVLAGHNGPVDFAAWNPAGTLVVTASWDSFAKVWDTISGKELAQVTGYFDQVRHAIWNSDGTQFMTTSWGGPVRVFALPLGDTPETACEHAVRNLTSSEWESYLDEQPYRKTCPGLP